MKARLLLAAVAFVALSSIAVAQEQTQKAGCCKEKQKTDITNMAVGAVFEWFMGQMENKSEFEIRYPSVEGYVLKMVRESEE